MSDIDKEIAKLSSEKQKLLELLLKEKGLHTTPIQTTAQEKQTPFGNLSDIKNSLKQFFDSGGFDLQNEQLTDHQSSSADEMKKIARQFYNAVSQQLDATFFAQNSIFLNYGYVADQNKQYSKIELPENFLNKNSIKLILEVIGDCDITGSEILDIGCGRGGLVYTINKYFNVKRINGIDLSPVAISFCKDNYQYQNASFDVGDAEQLPFENDSFDVVTNVESSHNYPNIYNFYLEVSRVLRVGGYFLYTDLLPVNRFAEHLTFLQEMKFTIERNQDISSNVLLSCDETASRHLDVFKDLSKEDGEVMRNFLAVPGSKPYDSMKSGEAAYKIIRLKKQV